MMENQSKPAAQQRVFITGASSGIGYALAIHYAKQGAFVGLVARREALLHTLEEQLGKRCKIYIADVSNSNSMDAAAQAFINEVGTPDIVIANAGVSRGTLTEHKEDTQAFQSIFEINVFGLVNTFQPFIKAMQLAGKGQLVGIASVAGIRGLPGAGAYSASKAAAITYLESLRIEMSHSNIQVTTIAPGYIRTPMTDINDYPMPFLMDVDIAATKFAKAIENKRRFVVIPWQMGIVARIMRLLPAWLWDYLAKDAPHKSRMQ